MSMTALPHNAEAEATLVKRLFLEPQKIPLLQASLGPEDFYDGNLRAAYAAMCRLSEQHKAIDITTIRDEAGIADLDLGLINLTAGHSAPLDAYADMIRRDAFRRVYITDLQRAAERGFLIDDREELLSDLQDTVSAIMQGVEQDHLISPSRAIDHYESVLDKRQAGQGLGLEYGIRALDAAIQPAQGGDMIVIAARPSVGKTALAETISENFAAAAPYPVLFASLEMSLSQLIDRAVARNGNIDAARIVRGLLNDKEHALARETAEARRSVNLWYLDDAFATTASVRGAAAKTRLLAGGISAIFVDYLGLLKDAGDNDNQRVGRISRTLKAIAREFDVPIVVLSQLSRAGVDEAKLHHLRDSGAIEQDADVVMLLTRTLGDPHMHVSVAKNRIGRLAEIDLRFDAQHVRFGAAA